MVNAWSKENLWNKARLFVNYAQDAEEGDFRKSLWYAFALEMLARSVLSSVHPCLLADIGKNDDLTAANLFYACGMQVGDRFISVKASTVFSRCKHVIPQFTKDEEKWCNEFLSKRNEEVHTGAIPYFRFRNEQWQSEYFRIVEILLKRLGFSLEHLFGSQMAGFAAQLMQDQKQHIRKQTEDAIAAAKHLIEALLPEEIEKRTQSQIADLNPLSKRRKCPAGPHFCTVRGEIVHVSQPRLVSGEIAISRTIIPTSLGCRICGLKLNGTAALTHAGVGAEYRFDEVQDPVEFHNIDINEYVDEDRSGYYEPDYGND